MMPAIESMSPFNAWRTRMWPKLRMYTAAIVGKVQAIAPYALIELILPGGSVMALLLWLYRRQRNGPGLRESGDSFLYWGTDAAICDLEGRPRGERIC